MHLNNACLIHSLAGFQQLHIKMQYKGPIVSCDSLQMAVNTKFLLVSDSVTTNVGIVVFFGSAFCFDYRENENVTECPSLWLMIIFRACKIIIHTKLQRSLVSAILQQKVRTLSFISMSSKLWH